MSEELVFAIVLAAGTASRFGRTKQLAKFEGRPLVQRAVRTAEAVCGRRTLLVAGNDWYPVAEACRPLAGYLALNTAFRDGIASSLVTGVGAVAGPADAVMLVLADQPLVTAGHLRSLLETWRRFPECIVATAYSGTRGPPVIFPRAFYPELSSLTGDRGARAVLEANPDAVRTVLFEDAALDVDHPADLERL